MIFTLEALEARHGDALFLHYGESSSPKLIVIDGGPKGVYKASVRPRLEAIKSARSPDDPLPIRMMMVSHLDDDHINGVLALTEDLVEKMNDGEQLPYDIFSLWHNSFDDIIGNEGQELFASLSAAVKPLSNGGTLPAWLNLSLPAAAVVASVPQGRDLRNNANVLSLSINEAFNNLVTAQSEDDEPVDLGDGLKFTVVGPRLNRVEKLQAEWNTVIKKKGLAKDTEGNVLAASYMDTVYNLSSIVVLAEAAGKSMMLTGDAHGDGIIEGLEMAGRLKNGVLHVDLLKVPHHGSQNNVNLSFFQTITADHYVISANGRYGHPAISTLEMISEARGTDDFKIYFTNTDPRLEAFFKAERNRGKNYKVIFRDLDKPSICIDLGEVLCP
jgi:hypothetical protein